VFSKALRWFLRFQLASQTEQETQPLIYLNSSGRIYRKYEYQISTDMSTAKLRNKNAYCWCLHKISALVDYLLFAFLRGFSSWSGLFRAITSPNVWIRVIVRPTLIEPKQGFLIRILWRTFPTSKGGYLPFGRVHFWPCCLTNRISICSDHFSSVQFINTCQSSTKFTREKYKFIHMLKPFIQQVWWLRKSSWWMISMRSHR